MSSGEDLGDATPSRWRKPNVCERPVDPRRTAGAPSCGQDLPERSYTPPDPQGRKIGWSRVSPPPPQVQTVGVTKSRLGSLTPWTCPRLCSYV